MALDNTKPLVVKMESFIEWVSRILNDSLSHISARFVEWLGYVMLHCATIPSVLALLVGYSDIMPSLDVVFFLWGGLFLFFIKALINKDILNIVTIGVGFISHAILLAMIVFK